MPVEGQTLSEGGGVDATDIEAEAAAGSFPGVGVLGQGESENVTIIEIEDEITTRLR